MKNCSLSSWRDKCAVLYNTVTLQWARWGLKWPASRLFAQSFVQALIQENIKGNTASLAFVRGIHRWLVYSPAQRASNAKMLPFDDVIMIWKISYCVENTKHVTLCCNSYPMPCTMCCFREFLFHEISLQSRKSSKRITKWVHFFLHTLAVHKPRSKHFLYNLSLLDKISRETSFRVSSSSDMNDITVDLEPGSQLGSAMKSISKPRIMFTYYRRLTGYLGFINTWWRHQMETSSALLVLCEGNSPVTGEFPARRPLTRSFDVFFDLRLNKRLSKQW